MGQIIDSRIPNLYPAIYVVSGESVEKKEFGPLYPNGIPQTMVDWIISRNTDPYRQSTVIVPLHEGSGGLYLDRRPYENGPKILKGEDAIKLSEKLRDLKDGEELPDGIAREMISFVKKM